MSESHIKTLLREPLDEEAYYGLFRFMRTARQKSNVPNPLLSQPALKVALVTATDSKYIPFFQRLMGSVHAALRQEQVSVCVLDVGLTKEDAAALSAQNYKVVRPGWDIEFPQMNQVPTYLKAMIARPHLPKHFPGYHVYLWIDADAWVQCPSCLDDFVLPALAGAISIVPVISPAYQTSFKLNTGATISAVEWGRRAFKKYFGDRISKIHTEEPVLNSGAFAMRGDAPHWALWADALRHGVSRAPSEFFVEQTALNFAVYENDLPYHLLPATYNWQTHLSTPVYDSDSGLLCEPHLPHDPIKIVHLTGPEKTAPTTVRFLDGRTVRQSLAEPISRDQQLERRAPSVSEDSEPARTRGPGSVVTLPHLTQASSKTGRPLRIKTQDADETLSRFLRIQGVWQRDVSIFIDSAISNGDIFVDLGANLGYFTVLAAAAVGPYGRVHAFEPDPTNIQLLRTNQELNRLDNIICHQVAIGDASGRATLYRSRTNLGAHSLMKDNSLVAEPLEVRVSTLDQALVDEEGSITLIKIDLQGADLAALRGMTGLLKRQATKPMIILEYASKAFADQDPDLDEFEEFVQRNGYRLFAFITNTGQSRVPPPLDLSAFRALHESFMRHGTDVEIDLLLSPELPVVKRQ